MTTPTPKATITLGISEDYEYPVNFTDTGSVHVDIAERVTLVAFNAAELHNLADTLKGAAEELDNRQATKAGVDHTITGHDNPAHN